MGIVMSMGEAQYNHIPLLLVTGSSLDKVFNSWSLAAKCDSPLPSIGGLRDELKLTLTREKHFA